MTRYSAAFLAGGLLLASACAVNPQVYGPGPEVRGPVRPDMQADPQPPRPSLEGKIAACGHAGAQEARVDYPGGWHQRLSEQPSTSSAGSGELLGGPATMEVSAPDAQPLRPPEPVFPASAKSRGIEAQCYALMDVNVSGEPEEIQTACSSPQFNSATYEAVSQLRFAPQTRDGRDVRQINVVYPVTYCLDSGGEVSARDERY